MTSGRLAAALDALARRGPLLAVLFSVVLALPVLNSPLFEDDVLHRLMLRGNIGDLHWGPLELYDFVGAPSRPAVVLRDGGFAPWFTAEDLKVRFFRPLSSGLIAADARAFGNHVWPARLHSLLWFLAIVWLTARLHRRFLSPATAGLATLIYALAAGHAVPISWIAARHGLVCTALSLLAVWFHVRGREDGSRAARWLAVLAFGAGLLAGEMTLGAVALIGAWELVGRSDRMRQRIYAVSPFAVITLAYLAFYAARGYGIRGSGAYIGIDSGPAGIVVILRQFLILIGEMVAAVPSDAFGVGTVARQIAGAVWGAAMAIAAWVVFRTSRASVNDRELVAIRWMSIAAAGAALPGSLAILGGRVLTLALVPSAGVVAVLLVAGAAAVRDGIESRGLRRFATVAVTLWATGHLVAAPVLRLAIPALLARIAVEQQNQAAHAPSCSGVMVMVAAADPTIAFYVPATMLLQGRDLERLHLLSLAQSDHRIENVTRTGFDLVTIDRERSRSVWELLYRGAPLRAGTRIVIPSLDATVLEDSGGAPTRVRFDFGEPLDFPGLCFVQWRDGRIRPLAPPRARQTIELPHERGPMGF